MGATNAKGYGQSGFYNQTNGKPEGSYLTHRIAWTLGHNPNATRVEVPSGLLVRHTCDNPPCCNPAHLITGTQAQNTADMMERGRHPWTIATHCRRGHPYAEHGVIGRRYGREYRRCMACRRLSGH